VDYSVHLVDGTMSGTEAELVVADKSWNINITV
jgi:hypothetical protein